MDLKDGGDKPAIYSPGELPSRACEVQIRPQRLCVSALTTYNSMASYPKGTRTVAPCQSTEAPFVNVPNDLLQVHVDEAAQRPNGRSHYLHEVTHVALCIRSFPLESMIPSQDPM